MPYLFKENTPKIFYRDENPGSSDAVLLLHGLGANSDSWAFQVPALVEAGFRVLTIDFRGFGRSPYPGSINIQDLVSDTICILDESGERKINVVGISMGGTVALELALNHADRIQKMVLVNTFSKLRPPRLRNWVYYAVRFLMLFIMGLDTQARYVSKAIFPYPDQKLIRENFYKQILVANPQAYRSMMLALARYNVDNRINQITCPSLVITGENDNTVPPSVQTQLANKIPNCHQVIIPGAGHGVIGDQASRFNFVLLEFLRSDSPILNKS